MIKPMVDVVQLQRYLDDCGRVRNRTQRRFLCPITLRECDPDELLEGHILNQKFIKACRRTVIQYGKIDNFYGSRVEASLIEHLNLRERSDAQIITGSKDLKLRFADGSEVSAFLADSPRGRKGADRFPLVRVPVEGGNVLVALYAVTAINDPRLSGPMTLNGKLHKCVPPQWTAAQGFRM